MTNLKAPSLGVILAHNFKPVLQKKHPTKRFTESITVSLSPEMLSLLSKEANLQDTKLRIHLRNILMAHLGLSDKSETQEQVITAQQVE